MTITGGTFRAAPLAGRILVRDSEKQSCLARVNAATQRPAASSPQRFGGADFDKVMEAVNL